MKLNLMQVVRLVLMVLAVAGIIYALEYVPHGIAVWSGAYSSDCFICNGGCAGQLTPLRL